MAIASRLYVYLQALFGSLPQDLLDQSAHLYAKCIAECGALLLNCTGSMDETKIFMSRPGGHNTNRESCYSGHKRLHCLVHLIVTSPDGLMLYLHGPSVGRCHDIILYRQSGLDAALEYHSSIDTEQFSVFADSAFIIRPWEQVS